MNLKTFFKLIIVLVCIGFISNSSSIPNINSFQQLAKYHCQAFPIQILYRLSSGTLAQKYGQKFAQIDCYVRQFVNEDGQNKEQYQQQEQQEQQSGSAEQESGEVEDSYQYPKIDPIVQSYSKGLLKCLPQGIDSSKAVYKIWRFYRYVLSHDYAYQWMRAKIRSGLGYQAERPNSWMDGQNNKERLRLDKLFSNEFYDYVDKLMFKDFLFPIMTFFKKNVAVGIGKSLTGSGEPILMQLIESRNIKDQIFKPILFSNQKTKNQNIFTFTLPGIPLFLGGSSTNFAWAYTGVLLDRSNIQQIETVGNKFYHHGVQEWIKLNNVSIPIPIHNSEPYTCTYMHSSYGTLYEKHNRSGKISEYIARWHEDEQKVRNLFTQSFNMIVNKGNLERDIDFPWNSIVMANRSGLYNYLCQQYHPSYFIYPDLASQPDHLSTRWVTQPKKDILTIVNTHLTTLNQESYIKKQVLTPGQEQLIIQIRRLSKEKITTDNLWSTVHSISTDPLIKKRKQLLIFMYRKAKFVFFPEEQMRKQCDQLISLVQKWQNNLSIQSNTIVFLLWDYFFRQYTMNHVSSSKLGAHVVKHRVLTDNYWTNQPDLWKKGISYGQCDSNEWHTEGWHVRLNNTGLNSTCFYNIMRGINKTRQLLRNQDGSINLSYQLSDYIERKLIPLDQKYVGDHIDEAVNNFYSKNMAFIAQIGNPRLTYMTSYLEQTKNLNLAQFKPIQSQQEQSKNEQKSKSNLEPYDTQL